MPGHSSVAGPRIRTEPLATLGPGGLVKRWCPPPALDHGWHKEPGGRELRIARYLRPETAVRQPATPRHDRGSPLDTTFASVNDDRKSQASRGPAGLGAMVLALTKC